MVAVAEGFVIGMAAAAQRYERSSGQSVLVPLGIDDREIALDADRSIVDHSDFRCRHSEIVAGKSDTTGPYLAAGGNRNTTASSKMITKAVRRTEKGIQTDGIRMCGERNIPPSFQEVPAAVPRRSQLHATSGLRPSQGI